MNSVSIQVVDTPEKFHPAAEAAAQALAALLRELAAMENKSFAQYTRLCKKGQVVEFKGGVRREFTDVQDWKEERKLRFAALLDPHCTQKLITQRRDCLHAEHFPSSFNCVNTGCGRGPRPTAKAKSLCNSRTFPSTAFPPPIPSWPLPCSPCCTAFPPLWKSWQPLKHRKKKNKNP